MTLLALALLAAAFFAVGYRSAVPQAGFYAATYDDITAAKPMPTAVSAIEELLVELANKAEKEAQSRRQRASTLDRLLEAVAKVPRA